MKSNLYKFSALILLVCVSLSASAPTICNQNIAGVNFKLFSPFPVTKPTNVYKDCRILQNFTLNSGEYTGRSSIAVKPGCVYTPSELDLCPCKSHSIAVASNELQKLSNGANNSIQANNLLSQLKTVNSKTQLFGILKPNIDGTKLSYYDTIVAINYGLQSLTAATNIDQSLSDHIASCIVEIGNAIPVGKTCSSSDPSTVAGIVSAARSKLEGRNPVCCHDGNADTGHCSPGFEPTPCRAVQEDSVIWPITPAGTTLIFERCKTIFSVDSATGNISRTCQSQGFLSSWSKVDRCQCQSIHINSIEDRLDRQFAKNYTLDYLNILASFLNEKWNVVPNRVRPYNIFNRIFHIEQRRKVVDANQEAFMNLTSCLLSTANALISTTIDGNAECPLSVYDVQNLRGLFYDLASNFTSSRFVEQRLGSRSQFVADRQNSSSSIYHEMMTDTIYGCVAIGAVVPPASINDTILYNAIGLDIIGIGSDTVAPTDNPDEGKDSTQGVIIITDASGNITYISNSTNATDSTGFPTSQPLDIHASILSVITIVGLSLSTICLTLLVLCLLCLRLPRTRKWYIHGNLIAAVISSNVLFLFGADRNGVGSDTACVAISVILHYLFTAVYTWQLAEGVHLYRLLVTIFIKKGRWWVIIYTAIGWVAPAVIVGITAGAAPAAYSGATACFLRREYIWFFLGPMVFVVAVNLVIFCIIMYIIHKKTNFHNKVSNQEMNKRQVLKNDLRRAFALLPLLGICWIFIFFVQASNHPVPRYFFTILLSFQGVFVFIFHCIFDRQIMESLQNRNFRWAERSRPHPSSTSAKKYLNSPALRKSTGIKHPDSVTSPSSSLTDLHSVSQSNSYSINKNYQV